MSHKKHIAALDIGSTQVIVAIGSLSPEGLEIIGVGTAPNSGVRQGIVVNIESTTESILKAKEEAELMAGLNVDTVYLGIGGSHIESFKSSGMIVVRNKEVTDADIQRVIETAKAVAIPADRQILHVIPNSFKVDGQDGISDPIGMSGLRLEAQVHIITGGTTSIQNSVRCVEKAGLKVEGMVLQSLAAADAILSEDEKQMGVTAVDMGAGICQFISFKEGSVIHTSHIPVGGLNFTSDISVGLRTTQANAEELKKKYGHCISQTVKNEETVEVEGVGGRESRTMSRRNLCEIIEARAEETLCLVRGALEDAGLSNQLSSGIVLTGGSSQLSGLLELGDFIFETPIRLGSVRNVGGLVDVVRGGGYAAVVGLLKHGQAKAKFNKMSASDDGQLSILTDKIKKYFDRLF